ncbi:MAG: hypothetical protein V4539_03775 [Bacteroidota bacterium]
MANQFDTLLTVGFVHDYFGGDGYAAFTISPSADTQNDLLRMGFIFKVQHAGFRIVFDTQFQGSPRNRAEALKTPIELIFNLNNNDPNFLIYTGGVAESGSGDISKSLFCFTNRTVGSDIFRHTLQEKDTVSGSEMIPLAEYPEKFFSKPFGQVRIILHEGMEQSFQICFGAKSTHWRYLLVSDYLKQLVSPAVINRETGEAFIGPESIALPGNGEALAFYSVSPVMLTAKPNKSFQLVENYEVDTGRFRVVKGMLPNPTAGAISNLPGGETGKLNFSEILL